MRAETKAAWVNATVVIIGPLLLLLLGTAVESCEETSTVTADDPDMSGIAAIGNLAATLGTFAGIAFWRTRALSRKWLETNRGDWQGVAESALLGLATAVAVLLPGILKNPLGAPPYLAVYGTAGSVLGLIVGWVLRFSALTMLFRAVPSDYPVTVQLE